MRYIYFLLLCLLACLSCSKITDVKPDDTLKVPSTLDDCQALLDDDRVMNGYGSSGYPSMSVICADEYYLNDAEFDANSFVNRQAITWSPQLIMGDEFPDYDLPYRTVATANIVLTALEKIPPGTQPARWNSIYSSAHFFRSFAFFELAQVFAPAYDSNSAATDWGIPLPLTADINQKISRATVQQTYDQILSDLHAAENLPQRGADWKPTRPSTAAVYAMFSRVYMSIRNYTFALQYADSSLLQQSDLMVYDTIDKTLVLPFKRWNPEVIFSAARYRNGPAMLYHSHVDSTLFGSYQSNDLRKTLFFKFGDYFFGTYDEDGYLFSGLTTEETLLNRSECLSRLGNVPAAMASLNHLLQTRWAAGTFTPYVATDANDALSQILRERKKELLFRGTQWTDLRRLNKEILNARSITRTLKGIVYTLPPNDARWVLPIPAYVLSFNPDMPQNNR